tara:strand:+ start:1511 stop:2263 length:753 start_codon:yes stop_codon:yes gene_type:complete
VAFTTTANLPDFAGIAGSKSSMICVPDPGLKSSNPMKKLHAIVIGATGATGQQIVAQLLEDNAFDKISIFVRKTPHYSHDKLMIHKIDFSRLADYKDLIKGDVLFSALGTTIKEAGSKKNQYLVDYTYQYEFAKMAAENSISRYALVSSIGADQKSLFFYPKIKGELEVSVKLLKFQKIHIYQPPILIRPTELSRTYEKIAIPIFKSFNKIRLLKSQKPLDVSSLAKKMISEIKSKKTELFKTFKPEEIF